MEFERGISVKGIGVEELLFPVVQVQIHLLVLPAPLLPYLLYTLSISFLSPLIEFPDRLIMKLLHLAYILLINFLSFDLGLSLVKHHITDLSSYSIALSVLILSIVNVTHHRSE